MFKSYRVERVDDGGVDDARYFIRELRHPSERECKESLRADDLSTRTREEALQKVREFLQMDARRTDNNLNNFDRLYMKSEGLVEALEMVPFELGEGLRELRERRAASFMCGPVKVSRNATDSANGSIYVVELLPGHAPAEVLDADSCHLLALAMRRAGQLIVGYQGGAGCSTWTVLVQHF